ncbi:type II toxin-antitoxin system Phd/YefM family antitoxin [Paracoccus liaowanqingii]|uniref:type II toxin-antitoxin system Phd/YefM family antitoxin n=1 Tax=Paracoccus liaowanqingii TaxID=2560053 RepID=UPI0030B87CAE
MTSRMFNQDASGAKRAAQNGPVFITDRGKPAHVLLSIEAYRRLTGQRESIVDLLADPEAAEVSFEPGRLSDLTKSVDLS